MDTTDEEIPIEDLQFHTVCNREKYTTAIRLLLDRCSKYSVKALGSPNPGLVDEILTIPELVFNPNIESNNQNKQVLDIKTALEKQIKLITILNKQQNCLIAQKMKEL